MSKFHYAFKVKDIQSTRAFYLDLLACREGRSTDSWIDFDFFGNQLSAHVSNNLPELDYCGKVDGINVPMPHFGCLLSADEFELVQKKLESADYHFIVKPQSRYTGKVGEQKTMFILDYSGNPIEFKTYSNEEEIFEK